jgi:hypothetical protein
MWLIDNKANALHDRCRAQAPPESEGGAKDSD